MLYLGQTRTSRLSIPGARVLYSYCVDNPPCCQVYEHTPVSCEDGCEEWFLPYKFFVTFSGYVSLGGGSHDFGIQSARVRKTLWSNFTTPEQVAIDSALGMPVDPVDGYWATYTNDLSGSTWTNSYYGGDGPGAKGAVYLGRVDATSSIDPTYWVYSSLYATPGCDISGLPPVVSATMSIGRLDWIIQKNGPDDPSFPGVITRYVQNGGADVGVLVGRDDDGNCIEILPCQVGDFYAS